MNFFGSRRKKAPTAAEQKTVNQTTTDSIVSLKERIRLSEKAETLLEKKITKCLVTAKAKAKRNDKRGAMMELKRKKMYEKNLTQKQNMRLQLEQQIFNLEMAQSAKEQFDSTRQANVALQGLAQQMGGVDAVADVMEEVQENTDQVQEIQDLFAEAAGADGVDMDDLEAELEDLDAEVMEEELMDTGAQEEVPNVGISDNLPAVPTGDISTDPVAAEEEGLDSLEALMSA